MSETKNKSIETQIFTKIEIPWLSFEKQELLKQQNNSQSFFDIMKSSLITPEDKQKVLLILNNVNNLKLKFLFKKWFTLVDEVWIKDFINNPIFADILEKQIAKQEKQIAKQEKQIAKNIFENSYSHIREKINKFKEIFKKNSEFLKILNKLENLDKEWNKLNKDFQKKYQNLIKELATYLSKDQNAIKVFQKLQNKPDSYEALYKFLQTSRNAKISNILQSIPPNPKKSIPPNPKILEIWTKRAKNILDKKQKLRDIYFPGKNESDIKSVWNIIEARLDKETSKIVDTQTLPPKTFIAKYGYRIETKAMDQRSLDIRAAFTEEKIKIATKIENNSNQILHYNKLLEWKDWNKLQTEIDALEKKENKSIEDETKLYELKQEQKNLVEIQEKINKFQTEINALERDLEQTEKEFLKYYWENYSKNNTEQEAKNTLDFLHNLWLTNISQTDLQKIINEINRNQNTFNLSKKINLTEWFSIDFWDKNQLKREFLEVFKNIYKKMWIEINIDSLIAGKSNPEIENQSLFKQKLENAWITRWWSLQIKTIMQILREKN